MIGLDTNILARYYIEDDADAEASAQREAARRLIEAGDPLMVCKTVLLEFEWVMRGYYGFNRDQIESVLTHVLSLGHVHIEARADVERALDHYGAGFDFADGIHHASYQECESVATFDGRGFLRRAKRLGLAPGVTAPR